MRHLSTRLRPAAWLAALLLSLLTASVLVAAPANAMGAPTGSLTWGVKSSWRSYVTMFGGSIEGSGGATVTDGVAAFPLAAADLDEDGVGTVQYSGAVSYTVPSHGIDITLTDPAVAVGAAGDAVITVAAATQEGDQGRVTLASIDEWVTTEADGTLTGTDLATTGAAGAATVFGRYDGEAFDHVTLAYPAPVAAEPEPVTPTVTVSKTTDLDGEGETVTVTGVGFLPATDGSTTGTRPPLAGKFTGIYVTFGKYADTWQPSTGAASSLRVNNDTRWAVPADSMATIGGVSAGAVELRADGTFTTTLDASDFAPGADGTYGVYTYPGGGAKYAPFETATPVTFAEPEPEPVDPRVTVAPEANVEPGATVTVSATLPAFVDGTPTSVYVMWCAEGDAPVGTAEGRLTGDACDASQQQFLSSVSQYGGAVPATGTVTGDVWEFTTTLTAPDAFGAHVCAASADATDACGVFLRPAHTFPGNYSLDQFHPVTFATPALAQPVVTVAPSTNLAGDGDTVTVTGSGFLPAADGTTTMAPYYPAPLAGSFSGAYVAFGKFADTWKPSEGAGRTARDTADVYWGISRETYDALADTTGYLPIEADGTFSVDLEVSDYAPDAAGNYGVYTYPGGGVTYPLFETATAVSFATDEPVDPTDPVDPVDPVDPTEPETPVEPTSGDLVWGIDQEFISYVTGPIAAGSVSVSGGAQKSGALVTFKAAGGDSDLTTGTGTAKFTGSVRFTGHHGALDITLKDPQITLTSSTRAQLTVVVGGTRIAFADLNLGASPRTAGSGSVTLTTVPATLTEAGSAVLTYDAGTALDPVKVTLGASKPASGGGDGSGNGTGNGSGNGSTGSSGSAGGSTGGSTGSNGSTTTPVTVTDEPDTSTAVVGRLTWGISSGFRNYVTGPIAQGQISVSGASSNGSTFTFLQTGGNADAEQGSGSASYGGSVTFTGHHGALSYTFANPQVRLTSPTRAVLSVSVNGSRMDFANLGLAFGTRTELDGAVRYAGVPASLTAAGAAVLTGPGGQSLGVDPVTVTFGTDAATASAGGTRVVQTAAVTEETDEIPATPPATEGIELDDDTLAALLAGEVVTISVPGFEANEQGIRVVIYSTPTLLAEVSADANGVAMWTGSLPASLTGEHTLTFQGSQDVGIVLDIPAATEGMCVADASLAWGFKESFRSYIESTIANGEWTLDGVSEEGGIFTFGDGEAVIDPADTTGTVSWTGSIEFTGHDGALDTTIANPVIELSADGAYLLLDVSGETQDGSEVSQTGIRFAELDLAAAKVTTEGDVVTIAALPATLTDAGSEAFGTYPAGEALDSLSVALTSEDGCIAALAGGTTTAAEEPEEQPSAESSSEAAVETEAQAPVEESSNAWVWAVAALAVLAAAGAAVVTVRRRS
ncbi:HtaA domain-containing protein [Demequina sp. NBRC 110051]|uniref:HtaA domain-containing protein n=1 Tax=Demequina sp. NBRC 110051 TaxID=1570340 RepID=UPI00135653F0|nr:HtaA domain-containing protein [Demequina sp. NBRC 110051]